LAQKLAETARDAVTVAPGEDGYEDAVLREIRSQGEGADLGARRAWTNPASR
jgi:hypothetical protein